MSKIDIFWTSSGDEKQFPLKKMTTQEKYMMNISQRLVEHKYAPITVYLFEIIPMVLRNTEMVYILINERDDNLTFTLAKIYFPLSLGLALFS